jgi:pSer/pThr/pTyr-binding forkhead associated (FHA) protein
MAPTPDVPPPAPWGELVVQNGRLTGTRWPLRGAAQAVGQKEGCDFRLNVAGVSPLHCVLFRGPAGPVLLDLHSAGGTFVNGDPVDLRPLCEGDRLTVGPFQFRVQNLAPATEAGPSRDAVRVQVAAVAAQQAALTEEEFRLRQQRQALEQQEAQLAAHLEEKRHRLMALRDQARQAFTDVKTERPTTNST